MDPATIAIYTTFLAAQTGALVYFAGSVSRTLKDHERRLNANEDQYARCERTVIQLATKEGIQL